MAGSGAGFETCRLCSGLTDLLVPICSGEGIDLQLETKIARHLPIHYSADDALPQGICFPCVDIVQTWDSFVTLCVDTDAKLRTLSEITPKCEMEIDLPEIMDDSFSDSDDEPLLAKIPRLGEIKIENNEFGSDSEFSCKMCGREFKGKKALASHSRACKNRQKFDCDVCNQSYRSEANLFRHKEREHLSNQVECPVCQVSVSSSKLSKHLKIVHSVKRIGDSDPRFKCKLCDESFRSSYLRSEHLKQVHLKEVIKCDSCNFEGLRHIVKRHTRSVHAEKRYPCNLCSYAFNTHHLLRMHMAAHSDLRCYTCDICGVGFKRLNNVRDHMKCHQQKSNQCGICGNFFARKRYLAIHEKTIHNFYANGEVPEETGFECGTCGTKLKWKKNLMAHMRIHTGEKKYECKICNKGFVCHGSLRTHMTKHDIATGGGAGAVRAMQEGEQPISASVGSATHFNRSSLNVQ